MKSTLMRRLRVAAARVILVMTLVFVLGIAQVACGSEGAPKEFIRQDLSIIKPEKCDGGRHPTSCGGFEHRDTKSDTKKDSV